jgi:hypothetical protein
MSLFSHNNSTKGYDKGEARLPQKVIDVLQRSSDFLKRHIGQGETSTSADAAQLLSAMQEILTETGISAVREGSKMDTP